MDRTLNFSLLPLRAGLLFLIIFQQLNQHFKVGAMYLVFPVIVIVLSSIFIPNFWTELKGKHRQDHYDHSH